MAWTEDDIEEARALLADCVWHDYLHDYKPKEIGGWIARAMAMLERHGWKVSHLKELGTIAFDPDHMLRLIRFGTPNVDESGCVTWNEHPRTELNVGLWLATVPEIYRPLAVKAVENMFADWKHEKATDASRRQMVMQIAQYCYVRARDIRHAAASG